MVNEYVSVTSNVPNQRLLESCYILRTYERHGRAGLSNPWSLRQSLVYQKYGCESGRSVWIFVQLFQRCKNALWEAFSQTNRWHLANPHVLFLDIILPDWRWYLDNQRQSILEYVSILLFALDSHVWLEHNRVLEQQSSILFASKKSCGLSG